MDKSNYTAKYLSRGVVLRYDFPACRLHVYQTNDPLNDFVPVLERDGQAVVIENPSFHASHWELTDYLKSEGLSVQARLLAYHMAGAAFMPQTPAWATRRAIEYGHNGGGRALVSGFIQTFGADFDEQLTEVTNVVETGELTLAGMRFRLLPTPEAFDVVMLDTDALYLHLLGSDCHSLVMGPEDANRQIRQLNDYLTSDYSLYVSGHHAPEDATDVRRKIAYLKGCKRLAAECDSPASYQAAMRLAFPNFGSENFLEMSAPAFYPDQCTL
ncbi:MAG: hypothetical protein LBR39_05790 [Coriobacteriales bacterium]|jgi:hypothetical protein|nr:hypothetical protein [Coriobacteriales bacterium]